MMQYFESAACCSDGRACRASSRPKNVAPGRERGRAPACGCAPALGDQLELAVAVELVAKQIPEADAPRPDPSSHLSQRSLVALEQPELRIASGEQRRRDARYEVGAGPVVREPHPRPKDLG